ncbi:unnamed protein product [Arctogadus glacialis]
MPKLSTGKYERKKEVCTICEVVKGKWLSRSREGQWQQRGPWQKALPLAISSSRIKRRCKYLQERKSYPAVQCRDCSVSTPSDMHIMAVI